MLLILKASFGFILKEVFYFLKNYKKKLYKKSPSRRADNKIISFQNNVHCGISEGKYKLVGIIL